jgi:hypothetical protein
MLARMWEKGTLIHCRWECKLVQSLWKTVWRLLKKLKIGQAPVAHGYNTSYSGGSNQEDCSSKSNWANSLRESNTKYLTQKGLVEWLKV